MRYLATLSQESAARKFGHYLLALGIRHQLETTEKGWDLWVQNEDDLDRAHQELEQFKQHPDDPRYIQAARSAATLQAQTRKKEKKLRQNFIDVRTHWAARSVHGSYPLTIILILLSVLATAAINMGAHQFGPAINTLRISPIANVQTFSSLQALEHASNVMPAWPFIRDGQIGDLLQIRWAGLWEVRHGQIWRLITPIFMHFGILHLLFDMWWLYDLGSAVEADKGTWKLLGIVLLCGIIGNLAQFFWSGPNFGGMSGVVYGLFGYMWIKGLLQPQEGLTIQPVIVWFMLGWLVLCMTGLLGSVANGAHLIGLVCGMVLASLPYAWLRLRQAARRA